MRRYAMPAFATATARKVFSEPGAGKKVSDGGVETMEGSRPSHDAHMPQESREPRFKRVDFPD
jgi:hypothetical protein